MTIKSESAPAGDNYVNIVFATDEEYLPITAVALTSVIRNYKDTRKLRAFILIDKPLPKLDAERFEQLALLEDVEIHPVEVSAANFAFVRTSRGISIATYFRLCMHLALPPDVSKVAYLDSDMIIVGNIAALFDTQMPNNILFAGAEDYNSEAHRKSYNTPPKSVNLNAGVLVCNIAAMRKMDFLFKVSDYINKNPYTIFHGDQQILNHLFHDKMKYVHIRWNMHGQLFEVDWVKANMRGRAIMSTKSLEEGRTNPKIIHYNGGMKPWNGGAHLKRREWYKYATVSPYKDMFPEPSWSKPIKRTNKPKGFLNRFYKKVWLDKLYRALKEGYMARDSRIFLDISIRKGRIWKQKPFEELRVLSERQSFIQMHSYLAMRAENRKKHSFSAASFVKNSSIQRKIYANAPGDDLDGGFHENVKLIFKTPHVGMKILPYEADFALILHMAIRTSGFWDAMLTSSFDRDLIFGEAAFFAAYASYFDNEAPEISRRPFGYILDDMCYYYDARQPSRLETKLNDPSYRISPTDVGRCQTLIERVINERLTKYNRYAGRGAPHTLDPNSVVVIDQTPHDASIKFGGAEKRTITDMVAAALKENPDATVYFKRHPDNVQKQRHILPATSRVKFLPDDADITQALDQCEKVYVVSSQVGFEALLRNKKVVTFGMPFYAGWGLTDDRQLFKRRTQSRTIEELFYAACIDMSVYINPRTGDLIEIEEAFDVIKEFRALDPEFQEKETVGATQAAE